MKELIETVNHRIKLNSFTPSVDEYAFLQILSNELGINLSICPNKGYRNAPAIEYKGVQGYVQKHISGWQTTKLFDDGEVKIEKGTTCQLNKGVFTTSNGILFKCPKENTKKILKPVHELYCIIDNRKISLSQIEKAIDKHPEYKNQIKEFFNEHNNTK